MDTSVRKLNILKIRKLCEKLATSKASIYNKLNVNSKYHDPEFPLPVKLGENSCGWIEEQIDTWILSRQKSK